MEAAGSSKRAVRSSSKKGTPNAPRMSLQSSTKKRKKSVSKVQGPRKKVHNYKKQGQSPSAAVEANNSSNKNVHKRKKMLDCDTDLKSGQVISTGKHTKLKRKYFHHYNTIVNTWRRKKYKKLLKQKNENAFLVYFLSEFGEFISSELQETNVTPLILLKAFYYFFLTSKTDCEKYVYIKMLCIESLKKFLINPLRNGSLVYLLKDIAVDMLSEMGVTFSNDITFSQFQEKFRDPQMHQGEFYGTVLAWLSKLMAENGAKNVQCQLAKFSDILTSKFIDCPRVFYKLMSALESRVCCVPNEITNSVSSTETNSLECVSLDEKPLYDQSLVTNINKLIRNENMYIPLFHMKYEPRLSRPFNFCDILMKSYERRILSHFPNEKPAAPEESFEPLNKIKYFPDVFYETKPKASYMDDDEFWKPWDRFSSKVKETPPKNPTIYCGYVPASAKLNAPDAFERANTFPVLTTVSEMSQSSSTSQNELDSFEIPDINAIYLKQKKPPKKNLPPPPFIPLECPDEY